VREDSWMVDIWKTNGKKARITILLNGKRVGRLFVDDVRIGELLKEKLQDKNEDLVLTSAIKT